MYIGPQVKYALFL